MYDYQGNLITDRNSFNFHDYIYANTGQNIYTGLKVLYLSGDTTGMSGDVKKNMSWSFGNQTGTCTVKWQGSSSLAFAKKNYSVKLSENADWGAEWSRTKWGAQKKYVLKANYNDFSHAVYMCSARLWGDVVQSRGQEKTPELMWNSLNYGAVDGFPVMLVINGEYAGLYTIMTHKEITTNVESVGGYYLIGESNNNNARDEYATSFYRTTTAARIQNETDFSIVSVPDENDLSAVVQSLNNCINVAINAHGDWETDIANYLDVDAAIDYYIFRALLVDSDGFNKNQGLVSYDGIKWYHTVYDLDHCFAAAGTGASHSSPEANTWDGYKNKHRVFYLIQTYSKDKLKARYNDLRSGALREAYVFNTFANYINDIPLGLYVQEDRLWPHTPNSSTASLHQIAEWYNLRCKWSDEFINAL